MAKLKFAKPYQNWTPGLLGRFQPDDVVTAGEHSFKLKIADDYDDPPEIQGWTVTYKTTSTSSFEYIEGEDGAQEAVSGRVGSVEVRNTNGKVVMKITGLDHVDIADIYPYIVDRSAFGGPGPDAKTVMEYLMQGDDTHTGTGGDDSFNVHDDFGDDKYLGKGGNDYFEVGAGNDTVDGGAGFDMMSFNNTVWSQTARRGIVVDLDADTIIDAYGDTDTISNIETFMGSRFADTFKGPVGAPLEYHEFDGGRGADTFELEAASNVWIAYREEHNLGGRRGIVADLGGVANGSGDVRGTVRDGFGHTDKTVNVRHIEGTQFDDSYTGSRLNDHFNPGDGGVDSFDGGGGKDWMQFDTTHRGGGPVNVDLSRGSGQIIDDGYGNTETIKSVEGIVGSIFDDTLKGNRTANEFLGSDGNDTITGGKGNDKFIFGSYQGSGFGDVITDFKTGKDKLFIDKAWIEGVDDVVRFHLGDGPDATGDAQFFFDADEDTLYFDRNGNGDGGTEIVAVLQGATIVKNDIKIVENYIDLI